ncbi:PTPRA [Branchiostoma lanceolatum]|uniref:protein-tyrosine-phosphatase n=1 Tax=Branchiostoma lanceolatum TaxID=7740 RepID=A0A8K0EW21_BRALA|nr:PTPRA [Branchiostoma lanceolatum]
MGRTFATVWTVLLTLLMFIPGTLPDHTEDVKETQEKGELTEVVRCGQLLRLSCDRGVLLVKSVTPYHDKLFSGFWGSRSPPRPSLTLTIDVGKSCDGRPLCNSRFRPEDCDPRGPYKILYSCKEPDPCKKNPCEHGECETKDGDYTCKCYRRWTGKNCNKRDRNGCWSNPCQHGDCVPEEPWRYGGYPGMHGFAEYYNCECHSGWSGRNCELKIDPCASDPCQRGFCVEDRGGYKCRCHPGWTGKDCNQEDDPCKEKPCQHGYCVRDRSGHKCRCQPGWTGKNCHIRIDFCKENQCQHGTCENLKDDYNCKCHSGWSGRHCGHGLRQEGADEEVFHGLLLPAVTCRLSIWTETPLVHEGLAPSCACSEVVETATMPLFCLDINECYTQPCHFGTCVNVEGGYSCRCDCGWTGQNCTEMTGDKTTIYLRHGSRGRLVCLHGVLDVVSAQYRQDPSHGCQGNSKGCLPCNSHRMDQTAMISVRGKCNGRWYCDVVASSIFLLKGPDPCGHVEKRLEVGYRCVEGESMSPSTEVGTKASEPAKNIAGPSLTVICRSRGDPPPDVTWRRGEDVVAEDNKHAVVEKSGRRGTESYLEASLTIADLSTVDPDNERYVCLASNKEGNGNQPSSMVKGWSMPMKRQTQSTPIAIMDFLKPIPVAMLKKEFNRRLANEETLFTYEYEALPKLLGEEHSQACQNNRDKNRFRNIISYDHSRVILSLVDNDPRSDYINASYIDGYNEEKKYIATQGPMQNTVQDFWRMIWETRSSTILMLSNLVENCQNKVCKYWSETDTMAYGDFRVTLIGTDKMDYYIARKFLLTKETAATRREVTQFHFLAWPDFGVPDDPTDLLKFHQTVMKSVPRQNHPIVVHCSAGVGRTGTFITIDAMLEMMTEEKQVDVFGFVSKMRRNRSFMVQAKAQYVFIYQALLDSHLREDVTKAGKFKLWPPSALISQIKIATAQRTEGNSEDEQKAEAY